MSLACSEAHRPLAHVLLAKYDGRAPRYTSYPPATAFTQAVGAGQYRAWLAELPANEAISLYAHIPFCKRLCFYCGCNTRVANNAGLISRYVEGLRDELALLEQALPGRLPVASIHFGGGTPNLLSRDDMVTLFGAIRHVFAVRPGVEISMEADPAYMTAEWARAAAFHGVGRISLGVQDLTPAVQRAVNRVESFEQLASAVRCVRDAGIEQVNFDLMYGLPNQTRAGILQTLEQVLALRPDRLALFGYAHVPWMRPHQRLIREEALPDAAERLVQADEAALNLQARGYERIGMDHFALPSDSMAQAHNTRRLHRNFQGYTTDPCRTLIGLGVSSIGRLPQGYVQNQPTEIAWRAALDRDELPIARGCELTDEDRFRGDLIESLLCHFGVDLAALCARHGRSVESLADSCQALDEFARDGLISRRGPLIHVTEQGRPFVRAICSIFDAYRRDDVVRHSHIV